MRSICICAAQYMYISSVLKYPSNVFCGKDDVIQVSDNAGAPTKKIFDCSQ